MAGFVFLWSPDLPHEFPPSLWLLNVEKRRGKNHSSLYFTRFYTIHPKNLSPMFQRHKSFSFSVSTMAPRILSHEDPHFLNFLKYFSPHYEKLTYYDFFLPEIPSEKSVVYLLLFVYLFWIVMAEYWFKNSRNLRVHMYVGFYF